MHHHQKWQIGTFFPILLSSLIQSTKGLSGLLASLSMQAEPLVAWLVLSLPRGALAACRRALWLWGVFAEGQVMAGTGKGLFGSRWVCGCPAQSKRKYLFCVAGNQGKYQGHEYWMLVGNRDLHVQARAGKFWLQKGKKRRLFFYIWWVSSSVLRAALWKQNMLQSKRGCWINSFCSERKSFFAWGEY